MADDPERDLSALITQLRDAAWQVRQSAANALKAHGKGAATALPELRRSLRSDSDYNVRESALAAIAAIESDPGALLTDLEQGTADSYPGVRLHAASELARLEDKAKAAGVLWRMLDKESDGSVRRAAVEALAQTGDKAALVDDALLRLESATDAGTRGALAVLLFQPPGSLPSDRIVRAARSALPALTGASLLDDLGALLARDTDRATFGQLILDEHLAAPWQRGALILGDHAHDLVAERPGPVAELMLAVLLRPDPLTFDRALTLLKGAPLVHELDAQQQEQLKQVVLRVAAEHGAGLHALEALGDPVEMLERLLAPADLTQSVTGALLADRRELIEENAERLPAALPKLLIAGLRHPAWWVRQQAAEVMRSQARRLARSQAKDAVIAKLEDVAARDDDSDVVSAAKLALIELRQAQRAGNITQLEEKLRHGDDGARMETVDQIVEDPAPGAARALVRELATWIVFNDGQVAEYAQDAIRGRWQVVLPLLDQWEKGLELDPHVSERLVDEIIPGELREGVRALLGEEDVPRPRLEEIREWLRTDQATVGEGASPNGRPLLKRALRQETLDELKARLHEECERRGLTVRRSFARILADMSDTRFFEESKQEAFDKIKRQLSLHAVRILGRGLATEKDIDTRESIARMLANLGGREAVDMLTGAIVGHERTTARRQELLAEYYLDPSKARSDEAAEMLRDAVAQARNTLRLLQVLNTLFFAVAVGLVGTGLVVLMLEPQGLAELLAGSTAAVGGMVGIVVQVVREPLVRIQNALTRLVQVETAFASFIWALNLNGTYIQSQYVAEGVLKDEDIRCTIERIENSMHLSMDLVARYAEDGHEPPVPRLTGVSPSTARTGTALVLRGRALKPAGRNGRVPPCLAINHLPIPATDVVWEDDRIEFKLPDNGLSANGTQTAWVNAEIDGVETNALPFRLVASA